MYKEFELKNNNTTIYCRKIGAGTPILMIHGGGTDCDFYEKSAEILSKHYEVFTYDRRGYGRNGESADNDYSLSTQAQDAQLILKYINKPTYVFAHSYGGLVALELAKIEKELVKEYIIHEAPLYEDIELKDDIETRTKLKEMIDEGRYEDVIKHFTSNMGPQDKRQKPQSTKELSKTYTNLINFFKNEFKLERYDLDYKSLEDMNVTFCLGELSKDTDMAKGCYNVATKFGKQLLYFPGQHNGPYDLPLEFACLLDGFLNL